MQSVTRGKGIPKRHKNIDKVGKLSPLKRFHWWFTGGEFRSCEFIILTKFRQLGKSRQSSVKNFQMETKETQRILLPSNLKLPKIALRFAVYWSLPQFISKTLRLKLWVKVANCLCSREWACRRHRSISRYFASKVGCSTARIFRIWERESHFKIDTLDNVRT